MSIFSNQKATTLIQSKDVFEGEFYDSLPSINTASKYMFNVGSFSDALQYDNGYFIFTAPDGSHSFLSKDWYNIELKKRTLLLGSSDTCFYQEARDTLDDYSTHFLQSFAPYGYEDDLNYYGANTYDLEESKQETLNRYKQKFMSSKIFVRKTKENDKAIYQTEFYIRLTYQISLNLLTTSLIKKSAHKIIFWKESKSLIRQKGLNLKLSFVDVQLSTGFRQLLKKYVQHKLPNIYPLLGKNDRFSYWRKVLRNPFWTDIHSTYACACLKSNHESYARVMYHYKKYGTKKARQVLYETTNKALIKKYEELDPSLVEQAIQATALLLSKGFTIEKCLWYLTQCINSLKDQPLYLQRSSLIYSKTFFNYLFIVSEFYPTVTLDKLLKIDPREAFVEIRDISYTLSSIQYINDKDNLNLTIPEFTSIHHLPLLSTRLSQVLEMYKNKKDFIPFPFLKELQEKYDFEDDLFNYKSATNVADLRLCGTQMNICVGSYGSRVVSRSCDIVFVYKKDSPELFYSCIEISNTNQLRQVKLKRNERGLSDTDLNESVLKWCESRNISYQGCYDINESTTLLSANNTDPVLENRPVNNLLNFF